ncbi:MAG TPA: energy transducer TonB [Terriglobales bacterium]|jgi:protein TonB
MKTVAVFIAALIFAGLAIAQDKPASSPGPPSQAAPSEESRVYNLGHGVKPPRAIYSPDPKFTEEEKKNADKAQYKGEVQLSMIVTSDGKPKDIRVTKSLGPDLDKKAIEAVKTWKFDPATKDGKPVAVHIGVEVAFHLYR